MALARFSGPAPILEDFGSSKPRLNAATCLRMPNCHKTVSVAWIQQNHLKGLYPKQIAMTGMTCLPFNQEKPASPATRPVEGEVTRARCKFRPRIARILSAAIGFLPAIGLITYAKAQSLDEAVERYRPYLVHDIEDALNGAQTLQQRVASEDLQGARKAWISARAGWERSEVFTGGFAPDLDRKIDAWPNATTGFHAIEARLFGANHTDVAADASALVEHLNDIRTKAREIQLTPQGLLNGTAQLAYEIGESKSDGGESRISGTSLDDMRNNVVGVEIAYNVIFSSAITAKDPKLDDFTHSKIEQLKSLLDVSALNNIDAPKLREATEELVVSLQNAAPLLGLERPVLESTP
jgi:iron uptake system component EfeO